jgi:hypothetical protein
VRARSIDYWLDEAINLTFSDIEGEDEEVEVSLIAEETEDEENHVQKVMKNTKKDEIAANQEKSMN